MTPKEWTEKTIRDRELKTKRIEEGKKQAELYQREKKSLFKHIRGEYR